MAKTKSFLLQLLFLSLILTGCGSEPDTMREEQEVSHDTAIELNNGQKWKVVDEMLGYIRLMETDVKEFHDTDLEQYALLTDKLKNNLDLLTSNCTMEGKAHDELHKWLLPYIDLVDDLENAQNKKEAEVIFSSIQSSFETFNSYFE